MASLSMEEAKQPIPLSGADDSRPVGADHTSLRSRGDDTAAPESVLGPAAWAGGGRSGQDGEGVWMDRPKLVTYGDPALRPPGSSPETRRVGPG